MKNTILVMAIFFASLSFGDARAAQFDCSVSPGRDLCLRMNRAKSYLVGCEGSACYELWGKYLGALNRFSVFYTDQFLPSDKFDAGVGNLANALATAVCRNQIEGDAHWVRTITMTENQVLPLLKEIQQQAGLPVAKDCKKVIN